MHREDLGIGLLIFFNQKASAGIIAKAAWVDAHHVDGRLPVHNPMCQLPTRAACGRNPKAVALVQPEVFEAPCWPDDRRPVGRVGNRAIIDFLDAYFAKGRHAIHCGDDIWLKPFECIGKQFIFAGRSRAINIASGGTNFIRPKQQATGFLTHIIARVRFAQNAHFRQARLFARHDCGMLLRHQILVPDRDDRNIQPNHRPCLPRKVARTGYDMLASDVALIRRNQPLAIGLLRDSRNRCVAINRRAALPRTFCQRLRQIRRLDVTVIGMLNRANDSVHIGKRPNILDLVRR